MRMMLSLLAAALLSFALAGCAHSQGGSDASAAGDKSSFACPSGDCQGVNGAGNIGGNHSF